MRNIQTTYRLNRIAENLWLNQAEREKLFRMFDNSNSAERDAIVREIELASQTKSIEVRNNLKQRIRNS
jgi:hypothetical protein